MSDSRIGAYGAIALIVSAAGRAAAISAIGDPAFVLGALVAACAVSRGMMPLVMAFSQPAKADGLAAGAGTPTASGWGGALLIAVIVTVLAAPADWLGCLIEAAFGAALIGWFAQRNLGLHRRRARRLAAGSGAVRPGGDRECSDGCGLVYLQLKQVPCEAA